MSPMQRTIVLLAASLCTTPSPAEVKLPDVLGSGMVLPQQSEVQLWGTAAAGESLVITPDWPAAHPQRATADAQGRWRVRLRTAAAGGPYTIAIDASNHVQLEDVLLGELWLASGQSNMEMPVAPGGGYHGVLDWQEELARSHDPQLRFFTVKRALAATPRDTCSGQWQVAGPDTVAKCSAVAFFFARHLRRELHVPVGIVIASWGGTPAEAWMSREALSGFERFDSTLAWLDQITRDPQQARREYGQRMARWQADFESRAERTGWAAAELDDSDWPATELPASWSGPELGPHDGVAWFRRRIKIPRSWGGRELRLELGPIDDQDLTYFNGHRVGATLGLFRWNQPRHYRVPPELVHGGPATLAICVLDTGGIGGVNGKPEQLTLAPADAAPGEALSLAGTWRYRVGPPLDALPPLPRPPALSPTMPTTLFNGMIAPLTPLTLRGVIWYQGESNRPHAREYGRLFEALIRDWRRVFRAPALPFYYVQIAPFAYPRDHGETAELREAQRLAMEIEHTGMVVTTDIGDPRDIHPRDKREVGRRLALWALAQTYGRRELECSGPLVLDARRAGSAVRVRFSHAGGGLVARGGGLQGFELAGADGAFHPAEAQIDGSAVLVQSKDVPEPVAIRFGWAAVPQVNLFNRAGLPASPFRLRIVSTRP